jgi:hypothetical protein
MEPTGDVVTVGDVQRQSVLLMLYDERSEHNRTPDENRTAFRRRERQAFDRVKNDLLTWRHPRDRFDA